MAIVKAEVFIAAFKRNVTVRLKNVILQILWNAPSVRADNRDF